MSKSSISLISLCLVCLFLACGVSQAETNATESGPETTGTVSDVDSSNVVDVLAQVANAVTNAVANDVANAMTNAMTNSVTNDLAAMTSMATNAAPAETEHLWRPSLPVMTGQGGTNFLLWFPVGESVAYNLYWGVIPVGRATIDTAWTDFEGRKVISIVFKAKTSKFASTMFQVDDTIESLVDPATFLPVRYSEKIAEGRFRANNVMHFDHAAGLAHWRSLQKSTAKDVKIDADTRDVLCLMYFLRSGGMKVGDVGKFRVLVDEKLYDLAVTARKECDVFVTAFGDVECLEVKPVAKFGEIFVRKGEIVMWFSRDKRHILTKATGDVPLATFQAILSEVKGDDANPWVGGSKTKKKRKKLAQSR